MTPSNPIAPPAFHAWSRRPSYARVILAGVLLVALAVAATPSVAGVYGRMAAAGPGVDLPHARHVRLLSPPLTLNVYVRG